MSKEYQMDLPTTRRLIIEHAQLAARSAAGDVSAYPRMRQIETELKLSVAEIAQRAVSIYLEDYR